MQDNYLFLQIIVDDDILAYSFPSLTLRIRYILLSKDYYNPHVHYLG